MQQSNLYVIFSFEVLVTIIQKLLNSPDQITLK